MCSRSIFLLNVCLFNPKHIVKLMRWHFLRFKIDQFPNWTWFKVTHRRVNVLRRIVSENVFVHCIPIYNGFCIHTCWFQIQTSIEPYQSNYRLVWQMKKRFSPDFRRVLLTISECEAFCVCVLRTMCSDYLVILRSFYFSFKMFVLKNSLSTVFRKTLDSYIVNSTIKVKSSLFLLYFLSLAFACYRFNLANNFCSAFFHSFSPSFSFSVYRFDFFLYRVKHTTNTRNNSGSLG